MISNKQIDFGTWLKRQIEERLMSQEQFAKQCGASRDAICKWIANDATPRGTSVVRLAKALGINRDEIDSRIAHRPRAA